MRFSNKVAVVTGASRGMGKEMALAFAKEGADLVLAARTVEKADEQFKTRPGTMSQVAEEIRAMGRKVLVVKTDVTKQCDMEQLIDKTIKEFGKIDILVNSAWNIFFTTDPLEDLINTEAADASIGCLKGIFDITRAVLPHMRSRKYGKIINITSLGGKAKVPNGPVYAACKAGVAHFSRSVSAVVASEGITVNCVAPGLIDTPSMHDTYGEARHLIKAMIPAQRFGKETEIVNAVLFLADDASAYITGVVLSVDGGMSEY